MSRLPLLLGAALATSAAFVGLASGGAADKDILLSKLATHAAGPIADVFDRGAAEIAAYDPESQRLFVVNGATDVVDVLDISDPQQPSEVGELDVSSFGSPNSVAVSNGVVAVASTAVVVEEGDNVDDPTQPGTVAFFGTNGASLRAPIAVGATPDMLTFTPNGDWLLVANEAEPNSYGEPGSVDPEGSVSVIDLGSGVAAATVRTAGFAAFNGQKGALQQAGVRIFGPGATVAQDLEPEYIAVSHDSRTAWVTIQEANALAALDVKSATVTWIRPLGLKDHSIAGNGLDAIDNDGVATIVPRAVKGMYQPDGVAVLRNNGETFLLTANEGDVREWRGVVQPGSDNDENVRASSATRNGPLPAGLGRLNISRAAGLAGGDTDGDGDIDVLQSFGARSFSVWDAEGALVFDSGDDLEQITSGALGVGFNTSNTNNTFDNRSDDKGPEPEAVELGKVDGRWYAFVGLERPGGIVVYDLSDPESPELEVYVNNRDFTKAADSGLAGDLGPEGLEFVSAEDSPTGVPLLVVANEISGTTTIYEIRRA